MKIHSTTFLQHNMYDMHPISHVHHYHMYKAPPAQRVYNIGCKRHHLHNMYTMPHVQCTTIQCVHNTTCTQYHAHSMYMTPHVPNATCTTHTHHLLHTPPLVKHVHNTTCTQHHLYNYSHNTICT